MTCDMIFQPRSFDEAQNSYRQQRRLYRDRVVNTSQESILTKKRIDLSSSRLTRVSSKISSYISLFENLNY